MKQLPRFILIGWITTIGAVCTLLGQPLPSGHRLIPHIDTTPPALPTKSDQARGFQLFARHWMEAVF